MCKQIRTTIILLVLATFLGSSIQVPVFAQVDPMPFMPKPGVMVHLSPEYTPAYLKGIVIHPENALQFDFIIYKGDKELTPAQKKEEYTKLTKYFLASLAIPDDDQWVNLSPYEKDRIIKEDFGKTEMGRDLLAQDYMLKQLTASLIYPGDKLGKKFWDKVYAQAQQQYGTTNIPVNTFNKVWILPDDALIYEKGYTAYVLKNHLRVMLEEDYLSLQKHSGVEGVLPNRTNTIASKIVKEIVLPELEREVNEDENFAALRQVYSGMLLATWFKRALKESILNHIYTNRAKVKGVDQDPKTNEEIYQQYLKAYKKGVFNIIKEDVDKYTNETIPRKYFSGGTGDYAMAKEMFGHDVVQIIGDEAQGNQAMVTEESKDDVATVAMNEAAKSDPAMVHFPNRSAFIEPGVGPLHEQMMFQRYGIRFAIDMEDKEFTAINRGVSVFGASPVLDSKDPRVKEGIDAFREDVKRNAIFSEDTKQIALDVLNKEASKIDPAMVTEEEQLKIKKDSNLNILRNLRLGDKISFRHLYTRRTADVSGYVSGVVSLIIPDELFLDGRPNGYRFGMIVPGSLKILKTNQAIKSYPYRSLSLEKGVGSSNKKLTFQINRIHYEIDLKDKKFTAFNEGDAEFGSAGFDLNDPKVKQGFNAFRYAVKKDKTLSADTKKIALKVLNKVDKAMVRVNQPQNRTVDFTRGGIDLNSTDLNLLIKRDGRGITLPLAQQDIAQLSNIEGLDPVILSIKPASQTPLFSQVAAHI